MPNEPDHLAETRDRGAKKEPDQVDNPDQKGSTDQVDNPVVEVGTDPVFVREQVGTIQCKSLMFNIFLLTFFML